jgi:thiol-disulfide isomerase/thioredoxin
MTAVLLVIIVLVGLIAVVDLMLTYALVRRVNAIQSDPHIGDNAFTPKSGYRIGGFITPTASGREVSDQDLLGRTTLAAFVMPKCPPCHLLTDELSQMTPPEVPLLLFIAKSPGEDYEAAKMAAAVPFAAAVCVIEPRGAIAQAFDVSGFPTVVRIEDGVARASGKSVGAVWDGRKTAGVR